MAGGVVVLLFYLVAVFADFLAYVGPRRQGRTRPGTPAGHPSVRRGHLLAARLRTAQRAGPGSPQRIYTQDPSQKIPLALFAHGYDYEFLGLIPTNRI